MMTRLCAFAKATALAKNSGVALAGLRKLRARGVIADGESVVVILTAHGAKFSQVGVDYHTGRLPGLSPKQPNPPLVVSADLPAVLRALGL